MIRNLRKGEEIKILAQRELIRHGLNLLFIVGKAN